MEDTANAEYGRSLQVYERKELNVYKLMLRRKPNFADHSEKLLYSLPLFPLLTKEGIRGGQGFWN